MQSDASRGGAPGEVLGRRGGDRRSAWDRRGGERRAARPQTGANRRWASDHRGGKRTWRGVAQRGVLMRWWISRCESTRDGAADGWESARIGAARSGGFRGVGGRAGRHRQGRLDSHQALCGDSGQPLLRYDPWWHPASPPRALVAPRIPFTARIGVGAVQNRRRYHRVISTVCGDAGRPAHQRTETPRCARRHHDRFAPVCGPTARRFAPGPPTDAPQPRAARGPTMRRSPPR
jgi:hypothetical protein